MTKTEAIRQTVNIYRNCGVWCYALHIGDEYDHSDDLPDADSESDAVAIVRALWPDATVTRVGDTAIVPA